MTDWRGDREAIRAALAGGEAETVPVSEEVLAALGYETREWSEKRARARAEARDAWMLSRLPAETAP